MHAPKPDTIGSARVALIGADAMLVAHLRGKLIKELIGSGHAVRCFAPQAGAGAAKRLADLGAELASFPLDPPGSGPFAERSNINALANALVEWRPQIVVANGRRTTLFGIEAAAKAGVARIVPIVSGLDSLELWPIENGSWLTRARRKRRLKSAFAASSAAIFHNTSDVDALQGLGLLSAARLPLRVVNGAGVSLEDFAARPLPSLDAGMVFVMLARLDRLKGVEAFCAAARIVKSQAPATQFILAGPPGTGADGLGASDMRAWDDAVAYEGATDDPRQTLARAHVVVLPSEVEGMSRVLMEAAASGRPIIASDIPGCRGTVDERINGCLVPPGDAVALAAAMRSFLTRPDLLPAMARASRLKAERRFDERQVVQHELATILGHATSRVSAA